MSAISALKLATPRWLVLLVLAALALVAPIRPAVSDVRAFKPESIVRIHSDSGEHVFIVEVVDTPASRARGLMFRNELAPDNGMLFDFREEKPVAFWMQNTFIPLDMLFIRADGTIARIHADARPLDTTSIPSGEPVRFVLEIPGGRAAELGITAGDVIEHPRVVAD